MPKPIATPIAQPLSEIDSRVLPPTYLNHYEQLKQRDPQAAQEFWDKWAFDPRPKADALAKHEPALKALTQLNQVDRPLRRRV